jgi:hypothetical protein
MEITYKIIATDGKEYGPVNLEQLQGWIKEGRIASDTQLLRSDINEWRPASSFTEISLMMAGGSSTPALPSSTSASSGADVSPELFGLEKRVKSGGSWYYWVAALSLVNSVMAFSGGGGGFVIGLSVTQFMDAMLSADGGVMKGVGLALGVLAAGVFALFGVFACKRHVWAFIVGMLFYGLDTILTVLAEQWLGLAFHGWVLFSLFIGTRAAMQINALSKSR